MELASWLQPWWSFWAGLTELVWWPAWAAVFTGAALWNTARLADRGARDFRRREAVFIMAVRELLNDFVEEARDFQSRVKSFSDGLTASKLSDEDLKSRCIELARETVKETWKEDKILEQIEDVKLINFPTVDAFILFSTGKIEIQLLREALDSYDGSKDSMARLDRDCDALFTTIDNLEAHAQEIAPFHLWGAGPPNFFDRLAQASQAAFSWFRAGWLKLIGSGR